jgi:mannosyltransferase
VRAVRCRSKRARIRVRRASKRQAAIGVRTPTTAQGGRSSESARRQEVGRSFTRWLWAIAGVGALLRFPTLGQQSFWTDEATTWGIVAHGLGHVLSTVPRTESTPYVYYVLLWIWAQVFGHSEAGLRSLSALCGVATIFPVAAVARRLLSERAGLAAALLCAVNPIMVWYSQEARAYALGILLSAVSLLLLLRALERPERALLLAWGASAAAAIAVHYFTAFVIVPEAVWLTVALHRRGLLRARSLVAALGPPVLVGAALLPLLIHQADGRAAFIAGAQGSLPQRLVRLVKEDVLGLNEPAKAALSAVAVLLILLVAALLIRASTRTKLALPAAVAGGGLALALLAALLGSDYIDTRNLLFIWPALAVLAGGALASGSPGRAGGAGLAAFVALSLVCVVSVVMTPLYQRANWRGVGRALGQAGSPRAIVGTRLEYVSLGPYVRGLRRPAGAAVRVDEVDVFSLALQSTPPPALTAPTGLPGFRLVQRVDATTFSLLRYRAPGPVSVTVAALHSLSERSGAGANPVLVQSPGR